MLSNYIEAAMKHAKFEWLDSDRAWYGEIPDLPGVWATSKGAFSRLQSRPYN